MKIKTVKFGDVEIDKEELIVFPEGLPGFSNAKQFAFLESPEIAPFAWLQSAEDPAVAFVIVDPLVVDKDYQIQVRPEDIECLELEDPGDARVLAIVVVPSDPKMATVNLMGPIIVNPRNRKAKQVVLADSRLSVRHPVWPKSEEKEGASCSS